VAALEERFNFPSMNLAAADVRRLKMENAATGINH
jgi:hypothetical protein